MIEIRKGNEVDAGGMIAILNPLIREGTTTAIEAELTLTDQLEYIQNCSCFFVAEQSSTQTLVGFQMVSIRAELPPTIADISTFVAPGNSKSGVGTALSKKTVVACKKQGLLGLNATIRADNIGGLIFYRSLGFQPHSVTKDVPLNDGRRIDRVSKRLMF